MGKKILFISNQGLSPLHLGIEMEVLEKLNSEDNEIILSQCDKSTKSCFFNPTGNPVACAICTSRSTILHRNLESTKIIRVEFPQIKIPEEVSEGYSVHEIESWTYRDVPIGHGVKSSVISLSRDYELSDQDLLVERELEVAVRALLGFEELVNKYQPDMVYLFNGRFSEVFPMISYCEKFKIPYNTIEVGSSNQKYMVYERNLPHSISLFQSNCFDLWMSTVDDDKEQKSIDWFENAVLGKKQNDKNYVLGQKKGLLPEQLSSEKITIAIFNSSEDEMKAIAEWKNSLYQHQNDAIQKILDHFLDDDNYQFFLRIHPNLLGVDNTQTRGLYGLQYKNLYLIDADAPIDSYELLKNCDAVVSFGSTIGIEATYHGKPSILVGQASYRNMDVVYVPDSYDELFDLIKSAKSLSPKPKQNTYPFAYYISTKGNPYKNFVYQSKHKAWYNGKRIRRFYPSTFWCFLKYLKDLSFWREKFAILYGRKPFLFDLRHLKLK